MSAKVFLVILGLAMVLHQTTGLFFQDSPFLRSVSRLSLQLDMMNLLGGTTTTTTTAASTTTTTTLQTTTTATTKDHVVYLTDSIQFSPDFSQSAGCLLPPYPIKDVPYAVYGLVNDYVMKCGGDGSRACYSLQYGEWIKQKSMKARRSFAAASSLPDGSLVVTGGNWGPPSVETFKNGDWQQGPDLPVATKQHCQVTLGTTVIITGNYNGGNSKRVYSLSLGASSWERLPDMNNHKCNHGCAVWQDAVYVVGGSFSSKSSVEKYKLGGQKWEVVKNLPNINKEFGQSIVLNNLLYAITRGPDSEIYRLDEREQNWELVKKTGKVISLPEKAHPPLLVSNSSLGCSSKTDYGIVTAGGFPGASTVEVYDPTSGRNCVFPPLPQARYRPRSEGLLICAGWETENTCVSLSSEGKWVTSHTFSEARDGPSLWDTGNQILIMGGDGSPQTTETITKGESGVGVPGFNLKYKTKMACSIDDKITNTVVITGGDGETKRIVSRYSSQGYVEDLPSLNRGRHEHGCGSYLNQDGKQVYLVAGGYGDGDGTTEVLASGSSSWVFANNMPKKMYGIGRGVTLGRNLYMTGGFDYESNKDTDEVWRWTGDSWETAGLMTRPRAFAATSTIPMDDPAMQFCV